jgi:ribosomal protein S26
MERLFVPPLPCLDRLRGLAVRVPGYRTQIYCVSCEVRNEFIYVIVKGSRPPLWAGVARVPGYRTEMYCVSCEVLTKIKYVM